MVLGNGGTAGDDRAEVLSGKIDWISSSLEAADKKESNEISGPNTDRFTVMITSHLNTESTTD